MADITSDIHGDMSTTVGLSDFASDMLGVGHRLSRRFRITSDNRGVMSSTKATMRYGRVITMGRDVTSINVHDEVHI